eukprot:GGOE01036215.1.p1 GENE.GGOE01036215.1~~GGOE01036215.1.p1  ORF type:complete len:181 (-),score=35.40 GGOE01036215.1:166-675(-)
MDDQGPNEGNGGVEEKYGYTWTQNDDEVIVNMNFPGGVSAKSLAVVFGVNTLCVGFKGKDPMFKGKLHSGVKEEDCTWLLEGGNTLVIYLKKLNLKHEEWWPRVIEGHQGINLKLIKPPAKHVQDLDDGAKSVIQKMMFDQQQKRLGLPTSDELLIQEQLQKAGMPSPF